MAKSQQIISGLVLLLAVGITWSRSSVANRKRTVQSAELIRASPSHDGFSFQIVERADNRAAVPTSIVIGTVDPHATGAYKGKSGSPPLHTHLQDDEELKVIEGVLGYIVDGKEGQAKAGEKVVLKAGTKHTFWNANPDNILKQQITLTNKSGRPSPSERFFEQWAGIAFDHGGINNVNPLQLLLTLDWASVELVMPLPAKLLVRFVALPLARIIGFQPAYTAYVLP